MSKRQEKTENPLKNHATSYFQREHVRTFKGSQLYMHGSHEGTVGWLRPSSLCCWLSKKTIPTSPCGECFHSHRDSLPISWSVAITSAQCDRAIVSASRGNLGFNWLTKNVLQGTLISELWRWRLPAKLSDTFLYFFAVFIFFISIFFCVCKSFIIICFLYLTSISLLCFFFFSCCTHERIWTCNFKFLYTRAWMNSLTIILIMPRFS
jgi:hypothetical protein